MVKIALTLLCIMVVAVSLTPVHAFDGGTKFERSSRAIKGFKGKRRTPRSKWKLPHR